MIHLAEYNLECVFDELSERKGLTIYHLEIVAFNIDREPWMKAMNTFDNKAKSKREMMMEYSFGSHGILITHSLSTYISRFDDWRALCAMPIAHGIHKYTFSQFQVQSIFVPRTLQKLY